jgi:hypothetical protein
MLDGWLALLLVPWCEAYESDQLTWRAVRLEDALPAANAHMDELIAQAIATTNQQSGCQGSDAELRWTLARELHRVVGDRTQVEARGELPGMSFGAYAAWLETAAIDRHTFVNREDIYGGVTWHQNLLLATVGPCSTIRLGEVLLGTDKIDHFLVQGYLYFRRSRQGQNPVRAVQWGTFTERAYWGRATTNVFSYADLAANYDGFTFYATLLEPGSTMVRDGDGCVAQARGWDWSEWVDWQYDEVLNPSAYRPDVLAAVDAWLAEHRDEVCAAWEQEPWMSPAERVASLLSGTLPYELRGAPMRMDVFALDQLCGEETLALDPVDGEGVEGERPRRRKRRQEDPEDAAARP